MTEKHWIYYPEGQDKYIFQRIFVQSNASPFNAPPGHSALTFEISHSPSKPLPVRGKRALIDACVAGPEADGPLAGGGRGRLRAGARDAPRLHPVHARAAGNLAIINDYLHGRGIFPIGRFGEWKYLNQDGAILSAKRVVESVQRARDAPSRPSVEPGALDRGDQTVDERGSAAAYPCTILIRDEVAAPAGAESRRPAASRTSEECQEDEISAQPPRPSWARRRGVAERTGRSAASPGSASGRAAATSRPRTASRS